jgi:hypothetical protein
VLAAVGVEDERCIYAICTSHAGALSAPEESPCWVVRDCFKIRDDVQALHRAFLTT